MPMISDCCSTNRRVCIFGLTQVPHERTKIIARRYPAPCSLGYRWQRSVWRGMLYAYLRWLIGAYVAQRLGG